MKDNIVDAQVTILTGEAYCPPPRDVQLFLCAPSVYLVSSNVVGEDASGTMCEHEASIRFQIQLPLSFQPTFSPTAEPMLTSA